MDDKKNLKPELKDIYDRIMNTNVETSTKPTIASPSPTSMPSSAPISTPQILVHQDPASPASTPTPEPMTTLPPIKSGSVATPSNPSEGFVFSSNNKLQEVHMDQENHVNVNGQSMPSPAHIDQSSTHNAQVSTTTVAVGKGFLNRKVIILVVIFIFVWTFFWLIFLGVIGS